MKAYSQAPEYRRQRVYRTLRVQGQNPRRLRGHVDEQVVGSFLEQHRAAVADGDVELATSLACKACDTNLRIGRTG